MSAVLFLQRLGNPAGQPATFSKTEMQGSPFLPAKLGNSLLQKTRINGANASAIIYSIVETAKANDLNIYKYLKYLLTEIPQSTWMRPAQTSSRSCCRGQ